MGKYKIEIIKNQDKILSYYEFIGKIPMIDESPETMLARCLLGEYICMGFLEDGKPVGVLIAYDKFPELTVVGIHLVGKIKYFRKDFYNMLKEKGYKIMFAQSKLNKDRFEKATNMKEWYKVYKKEL